MEFLVVSFWFLVQLTIDIKSGGIGSVKNSPRRRFPVSFPIVGIQNEK